MSPLRNILHQELKELIARHLSDIGQYICAANELTDQVPEGLLNSLEQLADICECPVCYASCEMFQEALECREDIQMFLKYMNQDITPYFEQTHIGQLWMQAQGWLAEAYPRFSLPLSEIWKLIAPVMPDRLDDLGGGRFEARWWSPVPMMDLELLKYTEYVIVDGQPFEPASLPGGLAVRFCVIAAPRPLHT